MFGREKPAQPPPSQPASPVSHYQPPIATSGVQSGAPASKIETVIGPNCHINGVLQSDRCTIVEPFENTRSGFLVGGCEGHRALRIQFSFMDHVIIGDHDRKLDKTCRGKALGSIVPKDFACAEVFCRHSQMSAILAFEPLDFTEQCALIRLCSRCCDHKCHKEERETKIFHSSHIPWTLPRLPGARALVLYFEKPFHSPHEPYHYEHHPDETDRIEERCV